MNLQYASAYHFFRAASEIDKNNFHIFIYMGLTLFKLNDTKNASVCIKKAIDNQNSYQADSK